MRVTGTVCEFNPIHGGHVRLLSNIRRDAGDGVLTVCVMSGSFVQRGEPAVRDKFVRARAAVGCGFDLVLELPAPWSFAPAELFARGAVAVLDGLGAVDRMVFGSECGDIGKIREYCSNAAHLGKDDIPVSTSHQKAAEALYREKYGPDAFYPVRPNDILACEYVSALERSGSEIILATYRRSGGGSATEARRMLLSGDDGFLPEGAVSAFDGSVAPDKNRYSAVIMHSLAARTGAIGNVPGLSGGAGDRLLIKAESSADCDELIKNSVCGRFSAARLRRGLLCCALGIESGDYSEAPDRVQLLAAGERGRELLSAIRKSSKIEIITRQSDVTGASRRADALYSLICGQPYSEMIKKAPFSAKERT
ncbi:MAG: nucleotidyltransferase family protein [Clostridia bacterium]|nr:nucleotidyltransferase family protein [Clostridia bacterium]